ncbi:radical SAM protein [bacterium]|nr:radical SAM protein [bacterium]
MSICAGETFKLKELNNLFIEMTSKNCNNRCNSCFIEFPPSRTVKDFIPVDVVKEGLKDSWNEKIQCIYLTGAEPMTHPDFNSILRMCLKRCNVCICTNGSFLNEKKIRFLKKVEDEGNSQIFFKLTLTHYVESENDKSRYRGNYRQTIFALKNLCRYNFTSVLSVQNYYKLSEREIMENFKEIFSKQNITDTDIQIHESFPTETDTDMTETSPDCTKGRVLAAKGIYCCPFLANDYRGRCGTSLKDYSKTISAETNFCITCAKNKKPMFSIG